ncbi:zinc finger dihydrouridine synthase [Lactarius akahatsu]|uniref:tRNA-dihydrouridine(47) synthase [NAD(P)(+)] n=1 Tax=Lactarius akahatsu TaxID=416441 RepID=A0AAD4LEJ4_9AGAM|nr:zinc finger dihydrouridine synthase [Lactarius akahatsu]
MSSSATSLYPAGTAPVKAEYVPLIEARFRLLKPAIYLDSSFQRRKVYNPKSMTLRLKREPTALRRNLSAAERRKLSKEEKKAQRGSNKGRRWAKMRDEVDLCWRFAGSGKCDFGSECRLSHDIQAYLDAKPRDIIFPSASMLSNEPPFVSLPGTGTGANGTERSEEPSVDPTSRCPVFEATGACRLGLKCRFLGGHVYKAEDGTVALVEDEDKKAVALIANTELNFVSPATLKLLRAKKYPTPVSDDYLQELKATAEEREGKGISTETKIAATIAATPGVGPEPSVESNISDSVWPHSVSGSLPSVATEAAPTKLSLDESHAQADLPDVPFRFSEKRRLNWLNKTYLGPLTTVGNLPFRRLCVSFGADITCGEMGLATSFLSGSKEEWSLVRRHPSETMFGVQVAGNKPTSLAPTAEVLAKECNGGIDFVDLNCGCPIDLVFRTGSGSALLDAAGKLGKILVGMNRALGEIPLTIKMRTGVKEGRNNAHKLMPRIGAGMECRRHDARTQLHGRTRQQRYTKLADWEYIKECVQAVRAREADEDLPRIPIFGGGDAFSAQDYWSKVESSGVDGIKERREWDISSRERLELIRKYAEFGLDHFGTDTAGVNTTRRYLCEALSFQYRYIPIGLLEHLPPRINDRAPLFRGRDQLETLLSSGDSRDWVKISEMFLGPAPESWTFTPKHKSNAVGGDEGQG